MAQYIDKDALIAEIERIMAEEMSFFKDCCKDELENTSHPVVYTRMEMLLSFIDTLEVKEEILDKEGKTNLMQKCVREAYKRGYDMGVLQTINKINHNMKKVDLENEIEKELNENWYGEYINLEKFRESAKHFFEFGLKAQKEE